MISLAVKYSTHSCKKSVALVPLSGGLCAVLGTDCSQEHEQIQSGCA